MKIVWRCNSISVSTCYNILVVGWYVHLKSKSISISGVFLWTLSSVIFLIQGRSFRNFRQIFVAWPDLFKFFSGEIFWVRSNFCGVNKCFQEFCQGLARLLLSPVFLPHFPGSITNFFVSTVISSGESYKYGRLDLWWIVISVFTRPFSKQFFSRQDNLPLVYLCLAHRELSRCFRSVYVA